MSQFSLFAEPESAAPAPVAELPPLRRYNADWLDVKITDAEFADEREQYGPQTSEAYVMLRMLAARDVRTIPCSDLNLDHLYDYVEAPFVIRKHTVPGFAVTCRQPPIRRATA